MTTIKGDPGAFDVGRNKKRKALDVVPVKMRQKDMKVPRRARTIGSKVFVAEIPEPGACIAEKEVLSVPYFEAWRVRPIGGLGPEGKFFLHKGVNIGACAQVLVPGNLKRMPDFFPHIFCGQRCRNRSTGPPETDFHQVSVSSSKLMFMNSNKILQTVTPAAGFRRDRVAGVQKPLVFLDSGLRRNDGKRRFPSLYRENTLVGQRFT